MSAPTDYRQRGQAVWLDSISSKMIHSGRLASLIEAGSIYGVTSNPTIFGQAIVKNEGDYNAGIDRFSREGKDAFAIYDALTCQDIAEGADAFRAMHEKNPVDGWISLEVLPSLAGDAEKTVAEARRLSKALGRPNVFIKVPATASCIPAIRELIGEGISINVTLMFNRRHYREVADAYLDGLTDLAAKGGDLSRVHSVASFFVSRVDTLVDKRLDDLATSASDPDEKARLLALRGKAGLANSRAVYEEFGLIFGGDRFLALQEKGARVQRPLWASTGTKNPAYSDLLYVENLVGPDTVNTMPEKTLEALLDHGKGAADTVKDDVAGAHATLEALRAAGIDIELVGDELQKAGVVLFQKSYDELLAAIESRRAAAPVAKAGVAE